MEVWQSNLLFGASWFLQIIGNMTKHPFCLTLDDIWQFIWFPRTSKLSVQRQLFCTNDLRSEINYWLNYRPKWVNSENCL